MSVSRFAVVAIGRNEGSRLRRCLESAIKVANLVVYVDSDSSDDSVILARSIGCEVVELDMRTPLTAAWARNVGFDRVCQLAPELPYVQFVDGDCEILSGWCDTAVRFLDARQKIAGVSGRRRERHPEHSIYNLLCDIEWDTPVGDVKSFGGDVMLRAVAFSAVDGFRANLIAGEEPELCIRLRAAGWRIWRLDHEMTVHDASMTQFSQWWKRTTRSGYAFAQGAALHGAPPERHWVRESRSAWFWGLGVPALTVACTALMGPIGFTVIGAYPLQIVRLAVRGKRSPRENWWRAVFLIIGKFPELTGQFKFLMSRRGGGETHLIEYK